MGEYSTGKELKRRLSAKMPDLGVGTKKTAVSAEWGLLTENS